MIHFQSVNKTLSILLLTLSMSFSQTVLAKNDAYIEALTQYKQGHYTAAYAAFSKLVQSDYESFSYNFYLARSATQLDKFDEAIAIYERILISHPNSSRAKIELGKLHYQQTSYAIAEVYFRSAFNRNLTTAEKTVIRKYLKNIHQARNKSRLNATIIVGAGHDSNVNATALTDTWFIPSIGSNINNSSKVEDSNFHQETVVVQHLYNAQRELGAKIKNQLLFYSKFLTDASDANIIFTRYTPSLIFPVGGHEFEAALEYNNIHYGKDPYLESYGIAPKFNFKKHDGQSTYLQAKLLKKAYRTTAKKNRDSVYGELSLNSRQTVNPDLLVQLMTKFQRERKDSGNLYDVDYDSFNAQIKAHYSISPKWKLDGTAGIREVIYQDTSTLFYQKRKDSNRKLSINLTANVTKNLAVQTRLERIYNQSNQQPYEYQKDTVLFNVIYRMTTR